MIHVAFLLHKPSRKQLVVHGESELETVQDLELKGKEGKKGTTYKLRVERQERAFKRTDRISGIERIGTVD
jgi:hypothetical protein